MQELYKIQMSMNKVLLKQATPVHLYTAYGCFQGCNHNEMAVDLGKYMNISNMDFYLLGGVL